VVGGTWARDLDVSAPESPYLAFVVGLHVATALALIVYFRGVGDAHRDGDGQQPVVGDGGLRDVPRGAGAGEQGMQGCQGEVDSSCSIKALVDGLKPLAGPSHVPCRVVRRQLYDGDHQPFVVVLSARSMPC
jgi:hypothetical protein